MLDVDEVAQLLNIDPGEVTRVFPVFGPAEDRSVLRDDVLEYLRRSEI